MSSTSDSESNGDGETNIPREQKISLSPSHARDLHEDPETLVDSIISDDGDVEVDEAELQWSDDEVDPKVDNLMQLINDKHIFTSDMFVGGATKLDVLRMIEDAKQKKSKLKKRGINTQSIGQCSKNVEEGVFKGSDVDGFADRVAMKVKDEIKKTDAQGHGTYLARLLLRKFAIAICLKRKRMPTELHTSGSPNNNENGGCRNGVGDYLHNSEVGDNVCDNNSEEETPISFCPEVRSSIPFVVKVAENGVALGEVNCRKSKRNKSILDPVIVGTCDNQIFKRGRLSHLIGYDEGNSTALERKYEKLELKLKNCQSLNFHGVCIPSMEFADIVRRTKCLSSKVVDLMIRHIRTIVAQEGS
ncbi:hypothetical protein AALP_AAs41881U000400 [Arabis alpina]|uniref:Uncharacterized protein n=1 Tax=Arabis alpina TaxID=50452 RepID=A0A087G106_ARAAL|nr:hypothetical protein AALP_AAs41881U000400 [Arabis alpina]